MFQVRTHIDQPTQPASRLQIPDALSPRVHTGKTALAPSIPHTTAGKKNDISASPKRAKKTRKKHLVEQIPRATTGPYSAQPEKKKIRAKLTRHTNNGVNQAFAARSISSCPARAYTYAYVCASPHRYIYPRAGRQ